MKLALCIISTILIGLDVLSSFYNTVKNCTKSPGYLVGILIGVAIKCISIVTIWLMFNAVI